MPATFRDRQIDAWRGISISLVLIGHLIFDRFDYIFHPVPFHALHYASLGELTKNVALRFAQPLAGLGVSFFFVISGYLITSLLVTEEQNIGRINIGAFYVRRIFRIVPAFAVLLAVVACLSQYNVIEISRSSMALSALFLCNTRLGECSWWLGHTWSLAVEEQFYLVWPLLLGLAVNSHRSRWLFFGYFLLTGLSYWQFITNILVDPNIFGNSFPCILVGAFFSVSATGRSVIDRLACRSGIVVGIIILLIQPIFASYPLIGLLLRPVNPLITGYIFFASLRLKNLLTAPLQWRWLSRLGLISYSLYLWQQLFTASPRAGGAWLMGFPPLCIPIAIASYYVIERPLIRIGHRISSGLITGRHTSEKDRRERGRNCAEVESPEVSRSHV